MQSAGSGQLPKRLPVLLGFNGHFVAVVIELVTPGVGFLPNANIRVFSPKDVYSDMIEHGRLSWIRFVLYCIADIAVCETTWLPDALQVGTEHTRLTRVSVMGI